MVFEKAKSLITEPFSVFHSITLKLHPIQAKRFPYRARLLHRKRLQSCHSFW